MRTAKLSVLLILTCFLLTSSLSLSAEPVVPQVSSSMVGYSSLTVVTDTAPLSGSTGSAIHQDVAASMGSREDEAYGASTKRKIYRVEGLGLVSSRSNVLMTGDNTSFAVKAAMPRIDGTLTLVGTLKQARLDNETTRWIQVLSLLATRRVNAEFTYAAQVSRKASFNTTVSCGLHPSDGSGAAELRADFRYTLNF